MDSAEYWRMCSMANTTAHTATRAEANRLREFIKQECEHCLRCDDRTPPCDECAQRFAVLAREAQTP